MKLEFLLYLHSRSSLFPHRPKPNGIHILKDYLYQALSNHPSSLWQHLCPMQLYRVNIHNDGKNINKKDKSKTWWFLTQIIPMSVLQWTQVFISKQFQHDSLFICDRYIIMIYTYKVNNDHSSTVWFTWDFTPSQQGWCCLEGPVVQCQCPNYCTKTYRT